MVVAGCCSLAKPVSGHHIRKHLQRFGVGGAHGIVQVLALLTNTWLSATIMSHVDNTVLFTVGFLALVALFGAVTTSVLLGATLQLANRFLRMNDNELFSAFHHTGYKCFLRMRLDTNETLTVWPIGTDSTKEGKVDPKLLTAAPITIPLGPESAK